MSDAAHTTPATPPKPWQFPAKLPRSLLRSAIPIAAMAAALSLIAVIYLGYDLAKGKLSPCEGIFQQTALGLSTKISFLKTEGQVQIGRERLTELDERAQMAALNLKTCCTVLDAGRLDPEQFLQCKGGARAYEARLADIADLVRTAVKDGMTTSSIAANAKPPPSAGVEAKIDKQVQAAQEISRSFNREVVAVREKQALQSLAVTPPLNVQIEAQESEPNDGLLATNEVKLGAWVTGSIGAPKDADTYAFTSPQTHRDRMRIELQNRSTSLEPKLELFDGEKSSVGSIYKTTPGADVSYAFVAKPATPYVVRVSNYYGESVGVYLVRVTATKSYDAHEPNDDVLHAKEIAVARPVAAGIMDKNDYDYYALTSDDKEGIMVAGLKNRSTTLQPEIAVYDAAKTLIAAKNNTTAGGDASVSFKVAPGARYYVRVRDYYASGAGDYTLMLSQHPPGDG